MPDDPLLPAAPALLGDEARDIVAAAVEYAGGRLRDVRPKQVQYRPGRSLAVLYDARIQWGRRERVVVEGIVAMTSVDGPPEGSLPLEADGITVGVWRVRNDPMLPGLAYAMSPEGARALLGNPSGPVSIALRAYRPTRRAVVAVAGADTRFAKVVVPTKTAELAAAHGRFQGVVPVPEVLSTDEERGIVALAGLGGDSLLDALASGRPLPTGGDILDLIERIASVPVSGGRRRSARRDADAHARFVMSTWPEAADRVASLVAGCGTDPETSAMTIHGDLYETQLLVQDGRITGVLDLDRSGPGDPADDLATMLAHLDALGIHRPSLAGASDAYSHALWADFSTAADPDDLRQRVAAVLVGLATSPFRLQRTEWRAETGRYLDHAEAWLDGARVAEIHHTPTPGGVS